MAQNDGIRIGHGFGQQAQVPKQKPETIQEKATREATKLDLTGPRGYQSNIYADNRIEGSVWNKYVDEHFNTPEEARQGKHHVKDYITKEDAIKSLSTYYANGLEK